jgi:hypothetical protein
MPRDVLASLHPHAELQALELIEPAHPLPIYPPALAPQEHPDAQRPKPRARMCQIANAHPQRGLIFRSASSVPRGSTELGQATGPQATDLEHVLKPDGQFSTACDP